MDKELIRQHIFEDWEYIPNLNIVNRQSFVEPEANYVVVGPRQSGKSFLLYQVIQQNMLNGIDIHDMVYINFDDERFRGMKTEQLDLILQAYGSIKPGKPMLFLDEIQNVDGWANFARRLVNQQYRVYITGSNAFMLSREMETVLGGRYMARVVMPYSFSEYLSASGVQLDLGWQYGSKRDNIIRHFNNYFNWGGYPDSLRHIDKRGWLNSLFTRIYFNDIVVRYRVRNENALRLVVHKLAESVKSPIALNRISNLVKATGVNCSPSAVMDYLKYLDEAFVIFPVTNYASKFVERETAKKYYFIDNGLLTLFINQDLSALLENMCAIELKRRHGEDVYFYNKNVEVDFFLPDKRMAIQASYRMADHSTMEREIAALVRLNAVYPLEKAIIITYEDETQLTVDGLQIDVLPLWKWMLTQDD